MKHLDGAPKEGDDSWYWASSYVDNASRFYSVDSATGSEEYTIRVIETPGYWISLSGAAKMTSQSTFIVGDYKVIEGKPSISFKTSNNGYIANAFLKNALTQEVYTDVSYAISSNIGDDGNIIYSWEPTIDFLRWMVGYDALILDIVEVQDISAPASVKSALVGGEIKVTWSAVADATGYQVRIRSTDEAGLDTDWISVGKVLSYTTRDLVLTPDTYIVAVRAVNDKGPGASVNEREFVLTKEMGSKVALSKLILDEEPTVYTSAGCMLAVDTIIAPSAAHCYKDEMKYTSSNPAVAPVDENGTITPLKSGWAMITASLRNKSVSYWICVNSDLESARFVKPESDVMLRGKTQSYDTVTEPQNIDWIDCQWTSSDEDVIQIMQGGSGGVIVEAVGAGKATIKLTFDNGISTEKEITVVDSLEVVWCDGTTKKTGKVAYGDKLVEALSALENVADSIEGKVFLGWYTEPEGKGKRINAYDVILEPYKLYGYWLERTDSFTVSPIGDMKYTGYQVFPSITVYDRDIRLLENHDYRVTYSRNINVGTGTVVVQGIGNYSSRVVKTFKIVPTDIAERTYIDEVFVAYNKRVQKPVVKVTDRSTNRVLRNRIDYEITYPSEGDYTAPGRYEIKVNGKGNYKGSVSGQLTICTGKLVSKLRVVVAKDNGKDWKCQGSGVQIKPAVKIYDGKKELTEGYDYSLDYLANDEVGFGGIYIYGDEVNYSGKTLVKFKIVGEPINKAIVMGVEAQEYSEARAGSFTGITLPNLKIYSDATLTNELVEEVDYRVYYSNNWRAGVCRAQIVGMGKYSGSVIKSFKINQKIANQDNVVINGGEAINVMYRKGGYVNPVQTVAVDGVELDKANYTVRITNTAQPATPADTKAPTITITFKNNYKGTYTTKYEISKLNPEDEITYDFNDVEFANVPNKWKSNAALIDKVTGKRLALNTDYKLSYQCRVNESEQFRNIDPKEILPVGTEISVVVEFNDKYYLKAEEGDLYGFNYHIVNRSIQKATVRIADQYYDKDSWGLDSSAITIKYGATTLSSDDYMIIYPDDYTGSVGTVRIVIIGIGDYGGVKTVTYKIKPRAIK